jgi:pimeloyl-ACP methyl ester carboxylesterase
MPTEQTLPLAFLPGVSGKSAVWRPIAERLAKRRPPVLVDYPGFGSAPPDPQLRSLADLASVVLAALPARCDLAALSLGGALALRLAIDAPERIRRLVLVTTSGGIEMSRFGAVDFRAAFRARHPDAPTYLLDDRTDLSRELGALQAPTLLVFGDADLIAPVGAGEFLRDQLPNAKLEVIAGATHDLDEEHPDLLASLMEAHLRKTD